MFAAQEYELIDFGNGRKLERFGSVVLDRPTPAANGLKLAQPKLWQKAAARFEVAPNKKPVTRKSASGRGRWIVSSPVPATWHIRHRAIQFELKLTPFGHVGVFPEQAANWDWLKAQSDHSPQQILNLFAYTGGSTLAAASAGAKVTHVDAARNIVAWARCNAELSGLSAAPIRWIVDDALKFIQREYKREQQYDTIILDPPSYGHGSGGQRWKIDDQLPALLAACRELVGPLRSVLLTCHAPNYNPRQLASCIVAARLARSIQQIEFGDLFLRTRDGRRLNAGMFARLPAT